MVSHEVLLLRSRILSGSGVSVESLQRQRVMLPSGRFPFASATLVRPSKAANASEFSASGELLNLNCEERRGWYVGRPRM